MVANHININTLQYACLLAVLPAALLGSPTPDALPLPGAEPEAEAAPQFNSLLTDHALAGHPLNNPFLPPTANAIAAATAAAHHPHAVNHALHDPLHATHALHHPFHAGNGLHHGLHPGVHHPLHHGHHGLPLLHPALSPALPIPSILPTLQAHVPVGACHLVCSILDLLVFNPQFSTFISLIKAANLVPLLSQPGPLTVFAPTNEAFDLLPHEQFEELLSDPVALKAILLRHMTRGIIHSVDLPPGAVPLITGAGERVTVTKLPTAITVVSVAGSSRVLEADNQASNGLVHVVDKVF